MITPPERCDAAVSYPSGGPVNFAILVLATLLLRSHSFSSDESRKCAKTLWPLGKEKIVGPTGRNTTLATNKDCLYIYATFELPTHRWYTFNIKIGPFLSGELLTMAIRQSYIVKLWFSLTSRRNLNKTFSFPQKSTFHTRYQILVMFYKTFIQFWTYIENKKIIEKSGTGGCLISNLAGSLRVNAYLEENRYRKRFRVWDWLRLARAEGVARKRFG